MQSFRYRPEILENVAEELTRELKQYEDWFLVEGAQLKVITDHFVKELEKGLSREGGCIVSTIDCSISCKPMLTRSKLKAHEYHMGQEIPIRPRDWADPDS